MAAAAQMVWVPSQSGTPWRLVTVVGEADGELLRVQPINGSGPVEQLAAADCRLANAGADQADMVDLTHLHEPGVLHNLEARYARGAIYTYTGTILIAVNPFQPIPELVKPGVMQAYQQLLAGHSVLQPPNREAATLAPHVHVRFFDDRP